MRRLCLLLCVITFGCKRHNLRIETAKKESFAHDSSGNWILPSQKTNGYEYTHIATQVFFTVSGGIPATIDILNNNFDEERAFWKTNLEDYQTANSKLPLTDQLSKIFGFVTSMWTQLVHTAYVDPVADFVVPTLGIVPTTAVSARAGFGPVAIKETSTDLDINTAYVLISILDDITKTPADQQLTKLTSTYGFVNPVTIYNDQNQFLGFFGVKNAVTVVELVDQQILMQPDFSTPQILATSLGIQAAGQISASLGQSASTIWNQILNSSIYATSFAGKRVWFAGLGTGGAIAALLGIYHGQTAGGANAMVYGFGAPRFANAAFAADFQTGKLPNVSVYQFYNQTDQIRFYPPAAATADIIATYVDPLMPKQ